MAEDPRHESDRDLETDQQDDVLGKIDQLLNRHRPKAPAGDIVPVPSDPSQEEIVPGNDGIPILLDVVSPARRPATPAPSAALPGNITRVLILRRMAIALDAEHIRLLAQIDRQDIEQARMLDRLVGELKRALPGAVRAALAQTMSAASQSDDDGQLFPNG